VRLRPLMTHRFAGIMSDHDWGGYIPIRCADTRWVPRELNQKNIEWAGSNLLARVHGFAYPGEMSDAARQDDQMPHGTSLLARDLTTDELSDAPVLESLEALLIEGLTDDEDDAFAAAINT
jgi:hypothetical protein